MRTAGRILALAPLFLALLALADIPPGAFSRKECKADSDCGLSVFDGECKQECCAPPTAGTARWVVELQSRCPKPAVCPPCPEARAARVVCYYGDCDLRLAPTREMVTRLGCKTDDDCVLVPHCCKDDRDMPICQDAGNKTYAKRRKAECKGKVCPKPGRGGMLDCWRDPQRIKAVCVEQLCTTARRLDH